MYFVAIQGSFCMSPFRRPRCFVIVLSQEDRAYVGIVQVLARRPEHRSGETSPVCFTVWPSFLSSKFAASEAVRLDTTRPQ